MRTNFDAITARMPKESQAYLPYLGEAFCDESRRSEVEAFFKDRVAGITGGPRNLAQALEGIALCSAFRKAQEPSVNAFLAKY